MMYSIRLMTSFAILLQMIGCSEFTKVQNSKQEDAANQQSESKQQRVDSLTDSQTALFNISQLSSFQKGLNAKREMFAKTIGDLKTEDEVQKSVDHYESSESYLFFDKLTTSEQCRDVTSGEFSCQACCTSKHIASLQINTYSSDMCKWGYPPFGETGSNRCGPANLALGSHDSEFSACAEQCKVAFPPVAPSQTSQNLPRRPNTSDVPVQSLAFEGSSQYEALGFQSSCRSDEESYYGGCRKKCALSEVRYLGDCTRKCNSNEFREGGVCKARCTASEERYLGNCVSKCSMDEERYFGKCGPKCSASEERIGYECKAKCSMNEERVGLECRKLCGPNEERYGNICRPKCGLNEEYQFSTNQCTEKCSASEEYNATARECQAKCGYHEVFNESTLTCESQCKPHERRTITGKCVDKNRAPTIRVDVVFKTPDGSEDKREDLKVNWIFSDDRDNEVMACLTGQAAGVDKHCSMLLRDYRHVKMDLDPEPNIDWEKTELTCEDDTFHVRKLSPLQYKVLSHSAQQDHHDCELTVVTKSKNVDLRIRKVKGSVHSISGDGLYKSDLLFVGLDSKLKILDSDSELSCSSSTEGTMVGRSRSQYCTTSVKNDDGNIYLKVSDTDSRFDWDQTELECENRNGSERFPVIKSSSDQFTISVSRNIEHVSCSFRAKYNFGRRVNVAVENKDSNGSSFFLDGGSTWGEISYEGAHNSKISCGLGVLGQCTERITEKEITLTGKVSWIYEIVGWTGCKSVSADKVHCTVDVGEGDSTDSIKNVRMLVRKPISDSCSYASDVIGLDQVHHFQPKTDDSASIRFLGTGGRKLHVGKPPYTLVVKADGIKHSQDNFHQSLNLYLDGMQVRASIMSSVEYSQSFFQPTLSVVGTAAVDPDLPSSVGLNDRISVESSPGVPLQQMVYAKGVESSVTLSVKVTSDKVTPTLSYSVKTEYGQTGGSDGSSFVKTFDDSHKIYLKFNSHLNQGVKCGFLNVFGSNFKDISYKIYRD